MGLFSFLNKNKQETTGEDGGYVSRDDDDALGARARSKRASSAGESAGRRGKDNNAAADPVLPEKKRARRRLVGAIALALAVAIGLPMILDSEPKPLATDIDIRIPAKEKAAPMPVPVATVDTLDKREEIIEPPQAPETRPAAPAPMVTLPREVAEVKATPVKPEVKAVAKAEPKPAEKPVVKPAAPAAKPDSERALAILEGKPAAAPASEKHIVQVAAFGSQDKANELRGKLKEAGIPAFTQKSGTMVRVRVGPFRTEEGEQIRAKLAKLGLAGTAVTN